MFAVAILANLSISLREAGALFGLFWAQVVLGALVPASAHGLELVIVSAMYLLLATGILVRNRRRMATLVRDGLLTPSAELSTG